MRFDIFTLFPAVFTPYLYTSILQRAITGGLMEVDLHDIRAFAHNRHHTTDDTPYGGGGGMVMKPEPIFEAVETILGAPPTCRVLLMTPQGKLFTQKMAGDPAQEPQLAIICGRYEGYDERIRQNLVTDEISIGDYVLTGGELPALTILDAITRLLPGALGDPTGPEDDSIASGLLEYPHYTRPPEFRGWGVPEVLLSGNHAQIDKWRREQALYRTWLRRPDLLRSAELSPKDWQYLAELERQKKSTSGKKA